MEIKQTEENIPKRCQLNEIQQEFLKQQIEAGFSDEQIKKYSDFANLSKEELLDQRIECLLNKKLPKILKKLGKIDQNLTDKTKQFYDYAYILKIITESIKYLEQLLEYELHEKFEEFYAIVKDKSNVLDKEDKIQLLKKIYEISINFCQTIQNDQKLEVELEKISHHIEAHEENMQSGVEYLQLAIDKEFLFVFDLKEKSVEFLKDQYKNWNVNQFLLCQETFYERRNELDKKIEVQLEYLKILEVLRQNKASYRSEKFEVLRKISQTYRRLNNHGEESKFLKEALKIDEFNRELNEQYWENQKAQGNELEANRLKYEFEIKQLDCQENMTNFLIKQASYLQQQNENYQKEFANYVIEQNLKYQRLTEEFTQKLERLEEKDKSQLEDQRKKNQKLEEQNQNNSKLLEEQSQKYEILLQEQNSKHNLKIENLKEKIMELEKNSTKRELKIYPNGEKYDGEWKNDIKEGKGIYYWADGDKYDGEWKNDIKEGKGIFYLANGNKYDGEWKNNKREGKGIFYWANGNKYDGEWKNGKREGKGIFYLANGNKYDGEWKNDNIEGKGIFYYKNGNKYNGERKNGIKEGIGIFYWANGSKYDGEWKNGIKEGKGIFYWADGDKYDGEWKNDIKEGKGTFYYANGNKYVGEWKNDQRQGKGTLYTLNWITKIQQYENDKLIS